MHPIIKPTIGRIVIYKTHSHEIFPAIVVRVKDISLVELHVFYPPGAQRDSYEDNVHYGEDTSGCWSWPPRSTV